MFLKLFCPENIFKPISQLVCGIKQTFLIKIVCCLKIKFVYVSKKTDISFRLLYYLYKCSFDVFQIYIFLCYQLLVYSCIPDVNNIIIYFKILIFVMKNCT